ncbi:hypothetical protein [Hydrogenophaga sp. MI9]|uniref:hypothetical protein n=1 Tax=Hydrogenophaga sp. MI9 TaxID=3453719 RepID=UPI003EEBB7B6
MQLREVIAGLIDCPAEALIFAERVNGQFRSGSAAVELLLSEAELSRPLREVAAERAPGMEYFLEASIVLDMLAEWRAGRPIQLPDFPAFVERVICYAEHDA